MAKKFLVAIDLQQNELQNVVMQNLAVAPSAAKAGQFYYNTATSKFCVYEGESFKDFATTAEFAAELAKKVDLTTYNGKVEEIEGKIQANADAIALKAAQADLEALQGTVNGHTTSIGELTTAVGTKAAQSDLEALEGTVGGHTTKIGELETAVGTKASQADLTALQGTVAGNTTAIGNEVTARETADQGLANRIQSLEDAELPIATTTNAGIVKVGTGLNVDATGLLTAIGAVSSVNGQTGAVVLAKGDVGLGNVDNTSDADKPISTATQAALDEKANVATTLAGYGITDAYTKSEVDAKVSSVYRFKGSVASFSALPTTGNVTGDVWNVEDTGSNYAWDGTAWDKLSETVDLTPYLTKTEAASTYLTIADATSTYLAKTDAATTYATKDELSAVSGGAVHKQSFTNETLTPAGGVATWTINHAFASADFQVDVIEVATGAVVVADVALTSTTITVSMNAASEIAAGTYKVVALY